MCLGYVLGYTPWYVPLITEFRFCHSICDSRVGHQHLRQLFSSVLVNFYARLKFTFSFIT